MVDRLQTLSKDDYDHLTHLQTFCQSLRDTRDSFLSLGVVSRIGGALFLSTASVVLTSFIQIYLNKIF